MRLIFKIAMYILLAGFLYASFLLIPPHVQIRGVEPKIPQAEDVLALMTVPNGPVRVRFLNTSDQRSPDGTLVHSVFVIEWANGNLFMIDAGMDTSAAVAFGEFLESVTEAEPAVVNGIVSEMLANDLQRVNGVGFTHLHIDHSQGIVNFCAARGKGASVYQTQWQKELQNFNTEEGAAIISASCLDQKTLAGEGVLTIDDYPGLGVIGVGGHTPGSTIFAIAMPDRVWLFAGDTTNRKANIDNNSGKGFIYSYLFVPENTNRTQALRIWLKELAEDSRISVVVSHDLDDIKDSGIAEYKR